MDYMVKEREKKGCVRFISIWHGVPVPRQPNPSLLYFNGLGHTLPGGLSHKRVVFFRYLIQFDDGKKLVFIILEYFRAKLIAIPVAHTLAIDSHLHGNLPRFCARLRKTHHTLMAHKPD